MPHRRPRQLENGLSVRSPGIAVRSSADPCVPRGATARFASLSVTAVRLATGLGGRGPAVASGALWSADGPGGWSQPFRVVGAVTRVELAGWPEAARVHGRAGTRPRMAGGWREVRCLTLANGVRPSVAEPRSPAGPRADCLPASPRRRRSTRMSRVDARAGAQEIMIRTGGHAGALVSTRRHGLFRNSRATSEHHGPGIWESGPHLWDVKKAVTSVSAGHSLDLWRARRDSNPQPSDP